MTTDELNVKHLEMIQAVVSRLAGNSFSIKGWSITLVSALFALAAKDANKTYAFLALLPALCFWGLDAYYLRQERLFRKLYEALRPFATITIQEPGKQLFSMRTGCVAHLVKPWFCTLFSPTIVCLHGPILVAIAIVMKYASAAK